MKSPLPEERLLKLLRGKTARPEGPPSAGSASPAPAAAMAGAAAVGAAASAANFAVRAQQIPWQRLAIMCLSVALGLEVCAIVVQALRPLPSVSLPVVLAPAPVSNQMPVLPEETMPSLSESVSRQLFVASAGGGDGERPAVSRPAPSGSAKQLASRLTLLGIVPGDPAQAIIEDAESKKTYFVSTGQVIVEGAVLEQVLDTHVILDLQGEKVELTL